MVIEIDQAYLVVFPHGTTLGENDDVALPNALSVRAGDEVAFGGGFHSSTDANRDLSSIPEECLTEEVFCASGEVAE